MGFRLYERSAIEVSRGEKGIPPNRTQHHPLKNRRSKVASAHLDADAPPPPPGRIAWVQPGFTQLKCRTAVTRLERRLENHTDLQLFPHTSKPRPYAVNPAPVVNSSAPKGLPPGQRQDPQFKPAPVEGATGAPTRWG